MRGTLRNKPQPSKMRFEVIEEGGKWSMYFCSDTDRKYMGSAPTKEDAQTAVNKLMKNLGVEKTRQHEGLSNDTYRRLSKMNKRRLQVTAVALDPVRAWKFYEELLMMNHAMHIMADSFDEVDFFFSACLDKSTREHFKIARKHIEALLDAVLNSEIQGNADDYCSVAQKALYVKERIMPLIGYCMSGDMKEHKWRLDELDRVLDNIMPDAWLEAERARIAKNIIDNIKGNANNEEQ